MSGDFILDTNIVIGLFAGDEQVIFNLNKAANIYIPSIVIGELYYGAYNSGKIKTNINRIQSFSDASSVLGSNEITARHYGRIKHSLKKKGKPIPENDLWIAALSFQYKMPLVSRDSHFKYISGIKLVVW